MYQHELQFQEQVPNESSETEPIEEMPTTPTDLFDDDENDESQKRPKLDEYWKIRNGTHFLYAIISNESPLEVKYFTSSAKGNFHRLEDTSFEVCYEDLDEKVDPPEIISQGKYRKFYLFDQP